MAYQWDLALTSGEVLSLIREERPQMYSKNQHKPQPEEYSEFEGYCSKETRCVTG